MTNPKDSGRYDAINDTWIDQNVRVDFAWGNIPMQPNDDRGMAQLDPTLDSHEIAVNGWSSFPEFVPNSSFDAVVPNLIGLTNLQLAAALQSTGLVGNMLSTTTSGATEGNTGKVATQNPAAGTHADPGSTVSYSFYEYIAPATTYPISAVTNDNLPGGSPATDAYMYLLGRTDKPTVGWYINIDDNGIAEINNNNYEVISVVDDDAFNTGGTKVLIRSTTGNLSSSGWTGYNGTWNQL